MMSTTQDIEQPPAGPTEPVVTLRVPQRFRYRDVRCDDQWFFGCVFPANPEWSQQEWILVASFDGDTDSIQTSSPGTAMAEHMGEDLSRLEWLDHDYDWSK